MFWINKVYLEKRYNEETLIIGEGEPIDGLSGENLKIEIEGIELQEMVDFNLECQEKCDSWFTPECKKCARKVTYVGVLVGIRGWTRHPSVFVRYSRDLGIQEEFPRYDVGYVVMEYGVAIPVGDQFDVRTPISATEIVRELLFNGGRLKAIKKAARNWNLRK